MLFNSVVFFAFFLAFYPIYLSLQGRLRVQNALLLVGSYFFYGWWDWRFLGLIMLSTLIDFQVGQRLGRLTGDSDLMQRSRRRWVALSVVSNLSILGVFKYFNFFAENFTQILGTLGMNADPITLRVALPVGISFYTFQTMSYTIDVYRRRMAPTDSMLDFAVFVAFFPQLVAGPIERASHLLPQVSQRRTISSEMLHSGLFLIVYGYFLKVFVADGVAPLVNEVFGNHTQFRDLDLLMAVLAFTVQIYGDFSGYSKIARGLGHLMGFDLMVNFRLPYFALNPSDFWRRWHISLSSWLRDYLYIPLGGNRNGGLATYRNLSITMLLGGLWHGAAWNFVIWGGFHGAILILYRAFGQAMAPTTHVRRFVESGPGTVLRWAVMLSLTVIGWLLFRAESFEQIAYFLTEFSFSPSGESWRLAQTLLLCSWPLMVLEPVQHFTRDLFVLLRLPWPLQGLAYAAMITLILGFGNLGSVEFIYFQF